MDNELNFDLKPNSIKKEVRIFPSILPDCSNDVDMPIISFPISKIETEKIVIKNESQEFLLNHYKLQKLVYQDILDKNFIAFSVDSDVNNYKRSMVNLIDLKFELFSRKVFITNFSLIKNFKYNVEVYLLNHEFEKQADMLFKELDFIKDLIEPEIKKNYFMMLKDKYNLVNLNVNQEFVNLRSQFLKKAELENNLTIFRGPNGHIVYPVMDICILECDEEIMNKIWGKNEFGVNILDVSFYDSEYVQNYKKDSFISLVNYLSPSDNNFYQKFKDNLDLNDSDFSLFKTTNNLFVEKEKSINFGKIESLGQLVLAKYNFLRDFPGSLIYSNNFILLGIATSQQNNKSIHNCLAHSDIEMFKNYNIFLPFYNAGVVFLLKKFMKPSLDIESYFMYKNKKRIFQVAKNLLEDQENMDIYEEMEVEQSQPNNNLNSNLIKKEIEESFVNKPYFKEKYDKRKVLDPEEQAKLKEIYINGYKKNPTKFYEMIESIRIKVQTKTFKHAYFNTQLQEKEKMVREKILENNIKISEILNDNNSDDELLLKKRKRISKIQKTNLNNS